jgi:hypothetical protein
MANGVFNISKGRLAQYGGLPLTNDAIIAVPIEATGLVGDSTMIDYADLATLLAGASNEQTTIGRKTMTTVTVTVDNSGDKVDIDCDDFTWSGATGNALGKVIMCYDNDTTGGTDSSIVPISYHDFVATPDGNDLVVTIASGGFASAG